MKECRFCHIQYVDGFGSFCSKSCQGKYARSKRKSSGHTKYNDPNYRKTLSDLAKQRYDELYGPIIVEQRQCENDDCEELFEVRYREFSTSDDKNRKFCSRSCAAKTNGKLASEKLKEMAANNPDFGFKNEEHRKMASLKSAQVVTNKRASSKPEREIRKLLVEHDSSWKAHRIVIDRAVDLKNDSLKIIFEYDGPSHFRNIFGDEKLQTQQTKDQETLDWCILNDWKLYRISDHYYVKIFKRNSMKVIEDIFNFIETDEIIRFRYTGGENLH